jgi:hypothetical protein
MAQKNHQNCCNTQPRDAHRNENKSEILLNVTMGTTSSISGPSTPTGMVSLSGFVETTGGV